MKKILTVSLACLFVQVAISQTLPRSSEVAQKIKRVETSLTAAVQIAGQPSRAYTLEERMQSYQVPALSIAVIHDGKLEWAKSYGRLSKNSSVKADTETLFQTASFSKPVSAFLAMRLVQEGRLALDEEVNKYLKSWKVPTSDFTKNKPVTLRGLLTHTAGLTVGGFRGYPSGIAIPVTVQILKGEEPANSAPVVSQAEPGSGYRYSGGGYVVLQQMVEDVMGADYATVMKRLVLDPIGMKNSTYQQPLPETWQARASSGHLADGQEVAGRWHTHPEAAPAGLWSTASDLALFVLEVRKALAGKSSILSQQMAREMLDKNFASPGNKPAPRTEDFTVFDQGGHNWGYISYVAAFAPSGRGVVVLTNSDNGQLLANEIRQSVDQAYNWGYFKLQVKPFVQLTSGQLKAFEGKYQFQKDKKAFLQFTLKGEHLVAKQLWDGQEFVILPQSELEFFSRDHGYPAKFFKDKNGLVTQVLVFGRDMWDKVKE
jgi:CubicO group peptidase (beta-lactamase class C family)